MSLIKVDLESVLSSDADYVESPEVVDIPVLLDPEYKIKVLDNFKKCLNSKNPVNQVSTYYPYSFARSTTSPRGKSHFPHSYMSASFLMTSFNINMTAAFKLLKTFNSFNKRTKDRLSFYRDGHLDLKTVHVNVRAIFDNTEVINEEYVKVKACVIIENEFLQEMTRFIKATNNLAPSDYASGNITLPIYKPLISISREDFLSMSPTSRLKILSQTINVKRNVLNIALNIKKDIGNLGREYHILTNIPRIDRAKISNLYGYDFESALQVIVLAIINEVNPVLELSHTKHFVENKAEVREYVVDLLGVHIDKAKKIITAAYQGGGLNGVPAIIGYRLTNDQKAGMDGLHQETQIIIEELLKISSNVFMPPNSILGSHFKAARWYASKRTAAKWELTEDFTYEFYTAFLNQYGKTKASKFPKSYMFYLWTYFEGEARKILESHLKQAISLHDAAYTQDKVSFDALDIAAVEEEIYNKIGINLKLGKA